MAKEKVVSLADRRQRTQYQALQAKLDPQALLDIPMGDINQYLDSANTSKSDPITLHGDSLVAVKRLLTHFGIDALPETVGQLMGALHYCHAIHGAVVSIPTNPKDDALWDEITERTLKKMMPELHPSYVAYKAGDIEALRQIARTRLTLPVMSDYFDPNEGKNGSWVSKGIVPDGMD